MYVSRIEQDKTLISQLSPPKFRYFTDQNGPKGGPHENKFWQLSNTKMNIANSKSSKSRWKNGAIFLVSFFPYWVVVLKLPKIVHFLQICADLCKKSNSVKAYLYPSERPYHILFHKIICFIELWATVHKMSKNKISKKYWLSKKLTKFINFKR